MELKEFYQIDKALFDSKTEELRAKLIENGWAKEDVDPIIKVLESGFVSDELLFIGSRVHVGEFNSITYRVSERTGLSWDLTKKTVTAILEAMGRRIEGSPLDLMNPPMEED